MKIRLIYLFLFLLVTVTFLSCSKQSNLTQAFNCSVDKYSKTTVITDFNKNFRLDIPTNWKTKLYYDKFQSEIFSADTTQQLTESFIFDASFYYENLNFDSNFYKRTDSILKINNLQLISSGNQSFQSKPAYWYLVKGLKQGFTFHQFNVIVKLSKDTYFSAYSEIYGDTKINERICKSISLLEEIEFLQ